MRAVIQRVTGASVSINGSLRSEIGPGLLVLVGIEEEDLESDADWLSTKIVQLRIFDDNKGIMNLSLLDTGGNIMIISQFTLHAKTKKGNRPSYIKAAKPEKAIPLYEYFIRRIADLTGKEPATGTFGAMMKISLVNDGPVTIVIDTREKE
jgi:D-tyrosyl-tRNA(Tyr) deacylase